MLIRSFASSIAALLVAGCVSDEPMWTVQGASTETVQQKAQCRLNDWTYYPVGGIHKWCPGTPGIGETCSVAFMCKKCMTGGQWSKNYQC